VVREFEITSAYAHSISETPLAAIVVAIRRRNDAFASKTASSLAIRMAD
jgi:hypothetical protein